MEIILATADKFRLELLRRLLGVNVCGHFDLGFVALLLDDLFDVHRQVRLNILKDWLGATLLE
jgi:hypothetical protein